MKNEDKISIKDKIAITISILTLLTLVVSLWYTHQQITILREQYEMTVNLTFEDFVENGNNYLEEGNYWEAIRYYDKALEIKPNNGNVLRDKGYAFINLGIDDESIKVTSYSDAEKFINYYFDYYKNHSTFEGRYYFERALDCFSDAKNSRPEDPEIRFYYSALGFYCPTGPDPIKSFNETISIIENIPPYKKKEPIIKTLKRCAWYAMGKAYKEIGQEAKAKECFRKANETK